MENVFDVKVVLIGAFLDVIDFVSSTENDWVFDMKMVHCLAVSPLQKILQFLKIVQFDAFWRVIGSESSLGNFWIFNVIMVDFDAFQGLHEARDGKRLWHENGALNFPHSGNWNAKGPQFHSVPY